MPWCDSCDHYLAPNSVTTAGACPDCGQGVDQGDAVTETTDTNKVPWHFWLMLAALVGYLGWRLIQGALWASQQL